MNQIFSEENCRDAVRAITAHFNQLSPSSGQSTCNGSNQYSSSHLPRAVTTLEGHDLSWKRFIGNVPDINPTNPVQLQRAQFSPDRYLVGKLSLAVDMSTKRRRAVRYTFSQGSIAVSADTGLAWVDIRESKLETLASLPLVDENASFEFIDEQLYCEGPFDATRYSLESLLWIAALFASRGRLPAGTKTDLKVRLRQRPDLTHLAGFPNLNRIVDFLSNRPASLTDLASSLDIPLRFVFAFYSGAATLGWINPTNSKVAVNGSIPGYEGRSDTSIPNDNLFRRMFSSSRGEITI